MEGKKGNIGRSTKKRVPIHHIKHHYKRYNASPRGLKVLISYSLLLAVLYFFFGILFPTTIVFGHQVNGPLAQLINMTSFVFMVGLIYGYIHRRTWVWEASLIWHILSLTSSVFSLIIWGSNLVTILADSIVLSSLVIFFVNSVTIWYIYVRKDYFKYHKLEHKLDHLDKIYIHIMTIFFVILVLVGTFVVLAFYQSTSGHIDDLINELRGNTVEEALFLCANKEQPERDLCFLTIAVSEPRMVDSDMCNMIFSNFYRLTCFEALS